MINGRWPHRLSTWNWVRDTIIIRDGRHYANQTARPLWPLRRGPNFTLIDRGVKSSRGLLVFTNLRMELFQALTITELESCGCGGEWSRYKTSSFGVLKQPISVNLTTAIVSSGPPCGCGPGALWQLSLIFPTFQQFNGIKLTSQDLTTQIYF